MEQKPQIVMENFDPSEKIIEGYMVRKDQTTKRFRETGLTIEEFKKSVRKKYGDSVDIVNKIKKNREFASDQKPFDAAANKKDDRFSMQDIKDAMKNKFSD